MVDGFERDLGGVLIGAGDALHMADKGVRVVKSDS